MTNQNLLTDCYRTPAIRRRMLEFLGSEALESVSAVYVTARGLEHDIRFDPEPPTQLWQRLEEGKELFRSRWDRQSLVAHLDVEYVNLF